MKIISFNEYKQNPVQKQKKIHSTTNIFIKGAREHNLKDIDVTIPKNKIVVVTGVSGSGKSSIVMDTLYAEGQRRYVESLSSYARQFLMRMNKPDVDYISGLCPAIAIEQKVTSKSSRSTVGSLTEIYDYLKLLFARIGNTYSPVSGKVVKKHTVSDVVDFLKQIEPGKKIILTAPVTFHKGWKIVELLKIFNQKGFTRIITEKGTEQIESLIEENRALKENEQWQLLIDRFVSGPKLIEQANRTSDSVQTAISEGEGKCIVSINEEAPHYFSTIFELDNLVFEEPTPELFSFNNPYGACKTCEGFGNVIGIDADLVFPDKNLSVYQGAIACWKGEKMGLWKQRFIDVAHLFDFPIHRPIKELTQQENDLLWTGNEHFKGLDAFLKMLEESAYKIQYRVMLSRYRGRTACPSCKGTRIREDANYVKIKGNSITDLVLMPIDELNLFFQNLKLTKTENEISKRILFEINNRLSVMCQIGLGYLSLNRLSNTLSGGESQRINLTRNLGSNLTGSMYILDEPSIGLHSKDTERLIKVLTNLRDLGNTVIVVEHDESIMQAADHILDIGPKAGRFGGKLVAEGSYNEIIRHPDSLTADYLSGKKEIPIPEERRKQVHYIKLEGAEQHNLQNIDVTIPLNNLVVVTGVSGSGKTTLIKKILYPALERHFNDIGMKPGLFSKISGDLDNLENVDMVDQIPIGRSSRSNPVTYVKAYDSIRELFSRQQQARVRGYKPKDFSFNVEGGRCEHCKGEGEITVEMQFLADIHLTCEHCEGKRFKSEVLEVTYNGKTIFDVLQMTVSEAIDFFHNQKEIASKLAPLEAVGLGYIRLGQSSSTLSGGEAQRVKLAFFLSKGKHHQKQLFILDEPTTGLHFDDINKLLKAFDALIENGHSIVVIEHNLDIIKSADWVIDLGPGGGKNGGRLLYEGKPEDLVKINESYTAGFLKEKLTQ
jgi:excinuclease ABC subunit A